MKFFVMILGCLMLSSCGDSTTYFLENEGIDTTISDTDSSFLAIFVLEEEDAGPDSSMDVDTDSDTDFDSDTESETDIETDTDTGSDSDTGTGDTLDPCPYDCTSETTCEGLDGLYHDEYGCVNPEHVCCEIYIDTGSCPYDCMGSVLCGIAGGTEYPSYTCGSSSDICCELPE